MKKIISFMLLFVMMCMFSSNYVDATENTDDKPLYITDSVMLNDTKELYRTVNSKSVHDRDIEAASYVVMDYNMLSADDRANNIALVKSSINNKKAVYIRADGYTANTTILYELLGVDIEEIPTIKEVSPESLKERVDTIGYVIYGDNNGNIKIVRQKIVNVIPDNTENIATLDELETNDMKSAFERELDCIQHFLDNNFGSINQNYSFSTFDDSTEDYYDLVSNADYDDMVSAVHYQHNGKDVGSVTVKIYAMKLPHNEVGETAWAFHSVLTMTPYWDDFKMRNDECVFSYTTYPVSPGNATYKNIIWDYRPMHTASGKENPDAYDQQFEISPSGLTYVVGWTSTYEDVTFKTKFEAGEDLEINIANWEYDVNEWSNAFEQPEAAVNSIDLKSSVIVYNLGHTRAGVQINYIPRFVSYNILTSGSSDHKPCSYEYILPEP